MSLWFVDSTHSRSLLIGTFYLEVFKVLVIKKIVSIALMTSSLVSGTDLHETCVSRRVIKNIGTVPSLFRDILKNIAKEFMGEEQNLRA